MVSNLDFKSIICIFMQNFLYYKQKYLCVGLLRNVLHSYLRVMIDIEGPLS
jgi:hypothetical protein